MDPFPIPAEPQNHACRRSVTRSLAGGVALGGATALWPAPRMVRLSLARKGLSSDDRGWIATLSQADFRHKRAAATANFLPFRLLWSESA